MVEDRTPATRTPRGDGPSALEVFFVALKLGLTAFGGPVAHLAYFERVYVRQRRWLSADAFAHLVALCQLAPGPASSQVGFLIGFLRAGWRGAIAAWVGFTLPSALLMFAFAWAAPHLKGRLVGVLIHGLELAAVAVVAQAVISLARRLCPDRPRTLIAAAAMLAQLLTPFPATGLAVMGSSALLGAALPLRTAMLEPAPVLPIGGRTSLLAGCVFLALLSVLPLAALEPPRSLARLAAIFYRSGALVFGGGHVVLPLLRNALVPPGWMSDSRFLAGYGAAQALPGPLFTIAAYLGAVSAPPGAGALWAGAALFSLFLPGLLLALAALPLWSLIARRPHARGALAGVNAAVVGILAAALYSPLCTSGLRTLSDALIAGGALGLLMFGRVAPLLVVCLCLAAAVVLSR